MEYQVHLMQVAPQTTAVVRLRANPSEFATVIPPICGEVWKFIRSSQCLHGGRLLTIYLDCDGNIECGAEVDQSFAGTDRVICSTTPAGTVATAAHLGPYQRLGEAHDAIQKWCAENGHALTRVSWEVYDHWNDDPAQLRTDVFYLLRPSV
jgi:effector-binding domain-containing protein